MAVVIVSYPIVATCDSCGKAWRSKAWYSHSVSKAAAEAQSLALLDNHPDPQCTIVNTTMEVVTVLNDVAQIQHIFWEDAEEFWGKSAWPMGDSEWPGLIWRTPYAFERELACD